MNNFRNYDGKDGSFATFVEKYKNDFGATVDFIRSNQHIYSAFG